MTLFAKYLGASLLLIAGLYGWVLAYPPAATPKISIFWHEGVDGY